MKREWIYLARPSGNSFNTKDRDESGIGPGKMIAAGPVCSELTDLIKSELSAETLEAQALYVDENTDTGKIYYYRLKAENSAGASTYSPILKIQK